MGGNADPTWGFAPMAVARIGADFFESTILMDTMALVVVRMGGERRFASLLRICGPVDDVDCWEGYSRRIVIRIKAIAIPKNCYGLFVCRGSLLREAKVCPCI